MTSEPRELIVIGGGIGGAAAALRAAQYLLPTAWVLGDKGTAKASRGKYVYNIDNMIGVHPELVLEKVRVLLEDQPEAVAALEGAHFQIGTQEIIDNAISRVRGGASRRQILGGGNRYTTAFQDSPSVVR